MLGLVLVLVLAPALALVRVAGRVEWRQVRGILPPAAASLQRAAATPALS